MATHHINTIKTEIFNDDITTRLLVSLTIKFFWKLAKLLVSFATVS